MTVPVKLMGKAYVCRNCDQQTDKLLKLPTPNAPISEVCETCFNEACNAEIEIAQNDWKEGELIGEWVKRCHAVSAKYGFADDVHKSCSECRVPRIHDPLCIECFDAEENEYASEKAPEADTPMRFEHAIDALYREQGKVRQQQSANTGLYGKFPKERLDRVNTECEAQIADIQDAIDNLYADP